MNTPIPKIRPDLVLGIVVLVALGYFLFSINQHAPVQRDGSHFLFMANNIAHGQNPYWASFETKNPLVEYYWSLYFRLFEGQAHIVYLARAAEAIYLLATAIFLALFGQWLMARQEARDDYTVAPVWGKWLPLAGATLTLFLLSSWRVNDSGLNIAQYQTLPEGLCIILMISLLRQPSGIKAILLGGVFFAAWFTKQTSVIAAGLPMALLFLLHGDWIKNAKYLALAAVCSLLLLGLFYLNLVAQDTLANYQRSTFEFKSLIFSMDNSEISMQRFKQVLSQASSFPDPQLYFASYLLAFFLFVFPTMVLVDVISTWRHGALSQGDHLRWAVYAWFFGSMIQACMGLTFYSHYFISSIAPALLAISLFFYHTRLLGPLTLLIVMAAGYLVFDYRNEGQKLSEKNRAAPMTQRVQGLAEVIPPDATIFTWGALSHFHVYYGKPSDYPQNMILPYVLNDVDDEERLRMFQSTFQSGTPDFVIEYRERLSPFAPLSPFPLTLAHLKQWTGKDYKLRRKYRARPGRYGAPVFVYVREEYYESFLQKNTRQP